MSKTNTMERQAFLTLTTSSQWILFLAIGLIIFSWVEKKRLYQQLGQGTFVLLGLFALWILLTDQIVLPAVVSDQVVPVEAQALSYFSGLLISGFVAIVAFLLGQAKPRWARFFNMGLVAIGLALFFMVYQLQRV